MPIIIDVRVEGAVLLEQPLATVTPTIDGDVLAALARADQAFSARALHRVIARHSADGVRRALNRLVVQGTVSVEEAPPAKLYRLNRRHLAAPYVTGLAQLRDEFLRRLRERLDTWRPMPVYAALFGSAARGEMRNDSDIDLFVVRPDDVEVDDERWSEQRHLLLVDASAWTGNDVRPFELSASEATAELEAGSETLHGVYREGIHLVGDRGFIVRHLAATPHG